jgi:hypothetical protein
MKKLILILLSVALIIGAGLITLAVIYRYDNIKQEKALQESQRKADMNSTVAKAKWPLEDELAKLKGEYNTLHAECLKGKASYDLLTVANQRKVEIPACGSTK